VGRTESEGPMTDERTTCERHLRQPVKGYSPCVGCEIEHLHKEIERLQVEAKLHQDEIRILWKCLRNAATESRALDAVKRGEYMTSEELLKARGQ
jgi:hypothetical protein